MLTWMVVSFIILRIMDFSQSESQELFNHLIVLILNDRYIRFMYIMLALWIQCIYFSPTMFMNTPQINTHLICCWQGQATDVLIQADHLQKLKRQLNNLLVHHTKRPLDVIGMNPSVETSCFQFQRKLYSDPHSYPMVMAFFVLQSK